MSFNYQVSQKDAKTGKEVSQKHYKLDISKDPNGGVTHKIESPIGSGNFFHANGEKIEIKGETQETVAINAEGQTKEEFDAANAAVEKEKNKHKK